MADLEIKRVPFLGAEPMAARDNDGQIWAGVRWMCAGIGLSEGQTKNERLKIQKDKVLSRSGRNFILNENGYGNREVLCIKLDYVPLWLAKINITPKMERETPKLAARLEQYQLRAKDVLAAAFLGSPAVEQRTITTDDYLRAASIVANCRNERLPYVLGFLEKGGLELPEIRKMDTTAFKLDPDEFVRELIDGREPTERGYLFTADEFNCYCQTKGVSSRMAKRYLYSKGYIEAMKEPGGKMAYSVPIYINGKTRRCVVVRPLKSIGNA